MKSEKENKELSDEEYWKQYAPSKDEEDFESMQNHEIDLDIVCKFKGINGGVIYETKETAINCNLQDLEKWFGNLKKVIRMLDESISDKEVGGFDWPANSFFITKMETQNYNQDKLEFRQIVLKHIQTILEISSKELRNKTYVTQHGNFSSTTEQEDTRLSYIQAIENLAYILIPYFDEKIKDIYEKCIKVVNGLDYEVCDLCKTEYERICKDMNKESLGRGFVIEMQLRRAKKLFVELNLLLNRNDYLKSAVYGEDKDELVSDDEESEGSVE